MALPILGAIVASALWLAAPAGAQTESKCLSSQCVGGTSGTSECGGAGGVF